MVMKGSVRVFGEREPQPCEVRGDWVAPTGITLAKSPSWGRGIKSLRLVLRQNHDTLEYLIGSMHRMHSPIRFPYVRGVEDYRVQARGDHRPGNPTQRPTSDGNVRRLEATPLQSGIDRIKAV